MASSSNNRRKDQADFAEAFTILTDVICAAFPILVLQRLQMNRRKKIGLSIVMSLGLMYVAEIVHGWTNPRTDMFQ